MSSPQRFSNGVVNRASSDPMGQLLFPDPTLCHVFFDDFNKYTAADWVVTTTEAGAGDATEAVSDADGGVLLLTNDAADNDLDSLQLAKEMFALESGKKAWFKARCKVSDATQSDFLMGITVRDTTPLSTTEGIWFQKDDGDTNLDFHVATAGTTSSASAIATVANDAYLTLAFYYDGKDTIEYWVNGTKEGTLAADTLPTNECTITFGIMNGEAVAKTMSIDYIFMAKER